MIQFAKGAVLAFALIAPGLALAQQEPPAGWQPALVSMEPARPPGNQIAREPAPVRGRASAAVR